MNYSCFELTCSIFNFGAAAALLSRMLLGNTALRKRDPRLRVITLHHF